ncbi:MAG: hypothetical protein JSR60_14455 [Proteobacteria bacterium]|nr:hypothetical protein [Pseudomonadota bacterium]
MTATAPLRWWRVVTALLALAVFSEAVFAGAMLSGFAGAMRAHGTTAAVVTACTLIAALVAFVALRRQRNGRRLAWWLLTLAAALIVQAVLGILSMKGDNVLWAHVPLGVALFGFAVLAVADIGRGSSQ